MREPRGNGNGTRRPDEILAEIHRTRDEMDQTLHAIEHRLTPGQLIDQGIDYLKNSGAREYAANLGSSVKTHPLPATLAGIGIAWLMAVGNKPAPAADYSPSKLQSTKEGLQSGMHSAKESIQTGMQSARSGWDQVLRDYPLALGAVGMAVGAVVAAMAPRTQKEDELMGEARDNLVDEAKRAGAEKLEKAKQAATGTPDTTKTPSGYRGIP